MCAFNPIHKKRFIIDVYTSVPLGQENFEDKAFAALILVQVHLNSRIPELRFYLKDTKEPAS